MDIRPICSKSFFFLDETDNSHNPSMDISNKIRKQNVMKLHWDIGVGLIHAAKRIYN